MIQWMLRLRSTPRARATTSLAGPARELAMQRLLQLLGQTLGVMELVLYMVHEPVHLVLFESAGRLAAVAAAFARRAGGAGLGRGLLCGRGSGVMSSCGGVEGRAAAGVGARGCRASDLGASVLAQDLAQCSVVWVSCDELSMSDRSIFF